MFDSYLKRSSWANMYIWSAITCGLPIECYIYGKAMVAR